MGGWPAIPPEAVSWLTPELDSLADEITAAIVREVPQYARPDDDSYARMVRQAAWDAVHGFVIRIASPATPGDTTARDAAEKMFRDIGRVEAARGHSLDALHTALRVGARVTWQRLRDGTGRGTADIEVLAQLGEAIFRHLDDLAAASAAGHAQARAELASETERLRRRLLDILVSGPPAPLRAVAALAGEAGWPLPRRVAVVAVAALAGPAREAASPQPVLPPSAQPPSAQPRPAQPLSVLPLSVLPPDVLVDLARRDPCLIIPDPDGPGRRQRLEAQLRSWLAPDLIVLDDFGLRKLTAQQSSDFYDVLVERDKRAATVITSNRAVDEWVALFDDPILANSALDRFAHRAHQIVMDGPSLRAANAPSASRRRGDAAR